MQKCDACHKPAWVCAECLKEVEIPKTAHAARISSTCDRLDEIRAKCEAGRLIRISDARYLLSEIEQANARAEAAEKERDIAVSGARYLSGMEGQGFNW